MSDQQDPSTFRELPRLTKEQRRNAAGNAAFERGWRELTESIRTSLHSLTDLADMTDQAERLRATLEDLKLSARDKLMARNPADPKATEIMADYEAPFAYAGQGPRPEAAPARPAAEIANEPTGSQIALGAKRPEAFVYKPAASRGQMSMFIHTERLPEGVAVQMAWHHLGGKHPKLYEKRHLFALDGKRETIAKAKEFFDRFKDARIYTLHDSPTWENLRDVYALIDDPDEFWRVFKRDDIALMAFAFDPELQKLDTELTLEHLSSLVGIDPVFTGNVYPTAPCAALMHFVYRALAESVVARKTAQPPKD